MPGMAESVLSPENLPAHQGKTSDMAWPPLDKVIDKQRSPHHVHRAHSGRMVI